jgi:hypothetical protein
MTAPAPRLNGPAGVRAVVAAAERLAPDPPQPLIREIPPGEPWPVEALGGVLAAAAQAIHGRTQAPVGIASQSVLAVASLAAQGHADVVLPTGQVRPTSLFLVTITPSGERKSAVDHEAMWPVRRREAVLR